MTKTEKNKEQRKPLHKNYHVLYLLILLLIILIGALSFQLYSKLKSIKEPIEIISSNPSAETPLPTPIKKTEEAIKAEKTLQVVREIEKLQSGEIKIKAYLKNTDTIEDSLILGDFVETIRFGQKIDVKTSNIKALNGYLFPPGEEVSVSSYGPGPSNLKSTRFDIAVLEINFTNKTSDTSLYELIFKPDQQITEINFDGAEISSDKSILILASEKISL